MQEGKIIQSVAKAMKLLDILAESSVPLSLAEISAMTGWPKSTIHGLLSTMRETSVVAQDMEGRYMLGIRLFEYGCTLSASWTIIEQAKPFIQHISYHTGEAVFLSILDRGEVITLDRADNRTGLQATAEMGCRPFFSRRMFSSAPQPAPIDTISPCALAMAAARDWCSASSSS